MVKSIKDIWYAVTSPECYRDFMNYKKGKIFLYVLVLTFLSGIITMGVPAVQFLSAGGFRTAIETGIPEFTASSEDGFWIEEPLEIDEYNFLIKANSDVVHDDITDLNGQYGSYEYVIMVDKEQIYVKAPGRGEVATRFDEMPGFSFSKEMILSYIPAMYLIAICAFVLLVLTDFGYYLITAFVISWGSGVVASFMKLRIGNKKLFKMSVYAATFSYILSVVVAFIGKSIPNFTFFSLLISTGYMYFALKDYKENGIEELPPEQFGNREG